MNNLYSELSTLCTHSSYKLTVLWVGEAVAYDNEQSHGIVQCAIKYVFAVLPMRLTDDEQVLIRKIVMLILLTLSETR